jgi:hypothetical protein
MRYFSKVCLLLFNDCLGQRKLSELGGPSCIHANFSINLHHHSVTCQNILVMDPGIVDYDCKVPIWHSTTCETKYQLNYQTDTGQQSSFGAEIVSHRIVLDLMTSFYSFPE